MEAPNLPRSLRIAAALSLFLIISVAVGYQAVSAVSDYTPLFGQGEHTVWDEDEDDFGNTYEYYAQPTDYGWWTAILAEGDYSTLVFVCYYQEETDSTILATRFLLNNWLPFAEEEVALTVTIGEYEPVEIPYFRRDTEDHIVESRVSGFDRSRSSETFTIGIGPFTFEHDIKGLFDVPVAQNILWCDDREVE